MLVCIIITSFLLAIDSPLESPDSSRKAILSVLDQIFTCVFILEMLVKTISQGMILQKTAYLRNPWNILDFIIIFAASVSSFGLTEQNISIVKTFRLARILRPLRLISRNEGLKISINSLIKAIPNIINLVMLNWFFFLLFGILGTNLFKGEFFYCNTGDSFPQNFIGKIKEKTDCMDYGGDWVNRILNFDHIGKSMMYLFVLSTKEAWTDAMHAGQDSVGIDRLPIENYNSYMALYFIVYIIIGSYMLLNLFVGVVFESFKNEKNRIGLLVFSPKNISLI